jgi:hypothetical protein
MCRTGQDKSVESLRVYIILIKSHGTQSQDVKLIHQDICKDDCHYNFECAVTEIIVSHLRGAVQCT